MAADVLMNDVCAVNRRHDVGELNRHGEPLADRRVDCGLEPTPQRNSGQVLEHERQLIVVPEQVVSLDDARTVERAQQLELVAIARQLARGHRLTLGALDDDARAVARAPRAEHGRRAAVVDRLPVLVARKGHCLQRHVPYVKRRRFPPCCRRGGAGPPARPSHRPTQSVPRRKYLRAPRRRRTYVTIPGVGPKQGFDSRLAPPPAQRDRSPDFENHIPRSGLLCRA